MSLFRSLKPHRYLRNQHPDVRIFHEARADRPEGVEAWVPGTLEAEKRVLVLFVLNYNIGPDSEKIDLVVTLGGDGTILHASSLFKTGEVPPVLSFSLGTLGFLLPFRTYRASVLSS